MTVHYLATKLHGVISHNTIIFVFIAVKSSKPTQHSYRLQQPTMPVFIRNPVLILQPTSTVLVFLLESSFKYGRLSSYRAGIAQYVAILRVERRVKLVKFLVGAKILSSPQYSQFHGPREAKKSRNATDHSSPFRAEVKNAWSHTANPHSPTYLHDVLLN